MCWHDLAEKNLPCCCQIPIGKMPMKSRIELEKLSNQTHSKPMAMKFQSHSPLDIVHGDQKTSPQCLLKPSKTRLSVRQMKPFMRRKAQVETALDQKSKTLFLSRFCYHALLLRFVFTL